MAFYIVVETQAQIEKYSFTTQANLGSACPILPLKEIFLFAGCIGTARITVEMSTLAATPLLPEAVAFRSPIWHRRAADRGHCR
jgi:hypothetical protein